MFKHGGANAGSGVAKKAVASRQLKTQCTVAAGLLKNG
jgi:hypothetical protein